VAKTWLAAMFSAVLLAGCSLPFPSTQKKTQTVTPEERLSLLRRAQVWSATDVAHVNIAEGPHDDRVATGATITCSFVPVQFGGRTPKFGCALPDRDILKVRYGRDNGEVYAGVAATRLLWALGFGADAEYPAHVICRHCPSRLGAEGAQLDEAIGFEITAIEQKFAGADVRTRDMTGWNWHELDLVDATSGGAPRAQRDALKLLAVLLQHTDNKAEQQRLVCRSGGHSREHLATCADPFLLIHDVGQTFGRANLLNRSSIGSVNLEQWSRTPIWKDATRCVGNLAPSQTGSLSDPVISEAGRRFLADLLVQLTEAQVRDLFSVARFADKPHGGGSIDAWVAAFDRKRDEIVSARCS
jgi:hypothetical protein